MHIVLSAHFKAFISENGLSNTDEAKSFEAFINYCIIKQYFYGQFDILDQIYYGDDPGIDGIMFIVDGELVTSKNEIIEVFSRPKKDMDVLICFTQAKTGERWEKKEINTFESGIMDFLAEKSLYPQDDYLKERKDIFKEIISNIRKVKNGKPRIKCYYATSGKYIEDREIEAAFGSIKARLNETGLFYSVDAEPLERDAIIKYWVSSYSPLEAKAKIIASALFPTIPGIEESYVITMFAKEYVEKILADENMNLRKGIFEENVRDFIGEDSPVNKEIEKTIVDTIKNKRFGIMNNGVTIVSPDIRLQSNELYLENYQIVNGCQTSNVLWENREKISPDATITLKIVETTDVSVVDDLVKSTNSQTKVDDHQFLATLDIVKNIEKYFLAISTDDDHRIYFERRYNQFHGQEIPNIRVFDIRSISRCVGAMFFDRPDLATRYPNQLTTELKDIVFDRSNKEEIYYTAAFTFYRLQLHFSNIRIPIKYRKFKWFVMMLLKYKITGKPSPDPKSFKIASVCKNLQELLISNNQKELDDILSVCLKLDPYLGLSEDRMKSMQFVDEIRGLV